MKNYNAVLTLVSDINKVFAHVTEDEDKIEPSDLIVLNKYMYRFINSIEVQPRLTTKYVSHRHVMTTIV